MEHVSDRWARPRELCLGGEGGAWSQGRGDRAFVPSRCPLGIPCAPWAEPTSAGLPAERCTALWILVQSLADAETRFEKRNQEIFTKRNALSAVREQMAVGSFDLASPSLL